MEELHEVVKGRGKRVNLFSKDIVELLREKGCTVKEAIIALDIAKTIIAEETNI